MQGHSLLSSSGAVAGQQPPKPARAESGEVHGAQDETLGGFEFGMQSRGLAAEEAQEVDLVNESLEALIAEAGIEGAGPVFLEQAGLNAAACQHLLGLAIEQREPAVEPDHRHPLPNLSQAGELPCLAAGFGRRLLKTDVDPGLG